MRRLLRSRLALGALALVLVSAAATTVALATRDGRPADFACTMVGYANIISIDFGLHFPKQQRELRAFEERYVRRHRGFPARGDAFTRRLVAALPVRRAAICTAGRCRDVPLESFLRDFPRLASVPVHSTDPVHVSVVVDRRSQPLQLASGTVRPRSSEPNGRGCGFWFHGSAKVDGSVVRDVSS